MIGIERKYLKDVSLFFFNSTSQLVAIRLDLSADNRLFNQLVLAGDIIFRDVEQHAGEAFEALGRTAHVQIHVASPGRKGLSVVVKGTNVAAQLIIPEHSMEELKALASLLSVRSPFRRL